MASIQLLSNQPSTPPCSNHVAIQRKLYQKLLFKCCCIGLLNDMFQLITNLASRNSANENARNILLVCQLTESWLTLTYVGETETRIWLVAKLTLVNWRQSWLNFGEMHLWLHRCNEYMLLLQLCPISANPISLNLDWIPQNLLNPNLFCLVNFCVNVCG